MPRPALTVSVVIPCYNAESFVAEAVASALGQTAPPLEVFCIDDGSTDGTLALLRRLEAEHPTVHVRTGPNGGPSIARNRGLAEAAGDYIQFLDADDLLAPTKLEHQLALAAASPDLPDLIAAAYRQRWVDGREQEQDVGHDPWASLVEARLGITSSNLWRRTAVLGVGGWREGLHISEDPDLMFRLLRAGGAVLRDETCLTTLRRRSDSLWNQDLAMSLVHSIKVRVEAAEHLSRSGGLVPVRTKAFLRDAAVRLRKLNALDPERARALEQRVLAVGGATLPVETFGSLYALAYRAGGLRAAGYADRVAQAARRLSLRRAR